ncbi:MAG: dTDP-glucose 4,6-dehydratase [Pseudomonadales bacterium]|nr:dTDP-glucose 4,6-dehydratase [Pseudomonadales bacterium]MAR90859.1 dTDP-glucose 4,6-dehydratase [Pseudomonadales bacterium]
MSNLLVTGGAGFIGSNFLHYWSKHHPDDQLIVLDALTYAGNLPSIQPLLDREAAVFVKGSICDQPLVERLFLEYAVDVVVNFAAESHVDRSITGPDAFIDTNIVGTHTLLKAARKFWLGQNTLDQHRFHHISTDEVFGSLMPDEAPFKESNKYLPNSPYSASKAASDHLVRAYHHTYGLNVTTSNCSNNYGPFHFPEKLIPLCITNILKGRTLPIYGDGKNIRDWLFVEDHCRGIDLVLTQGRAGETYNIGGNNEWDNLSLVKLICEVVDRAFSENGSLNTVFPACPAVQGLKCQSLIEFVPDRPGHDRRYAISTDKIATELNYRPQTTFEEGIKKTVQWYLDNRSWWQPLTND